MSEKTARVRYLDERTNPMKAGEHEVQEHGIDRARLVVHDYDRAGDYYSTWCLCGTKLTTRAACWLPHNSDCHDSVQGALAAHLGRAPTEQELLRSKKRAPGPDGPPSQ